MKPISIDQDGFPFVVEPTEIRTHFAVIKEAVNNGRSVLGLLLQKSGDDTDGTINMWKISHPGDECLAKGEIRRTGEEATVEHPWKITFEALAKLTPVEVMALKSDVRTATNKCLTDEESDVQIIDLPKSKLAGRRNERRADAIAAAQTGIDWLDDRSMFEDNSEEELIEEPAPKNVLNLRSVEPTAVIRIPKSRRGRQTIAI